MIKKIIAFGVVLAVVVAGGAFAQAYFGGMSTGVGGFFASETGSGYAASGQSINLSMETPHSGGGVFAFFDWSHFILSLGIYSGRGSFKGTLEVTDTVLVEPTTSVTNLFIGLFFGPSIVINNKLSLLSMFGFDYQINLSVRDEAGKVSVNRDGKDSFGALWIKGGFGMDYSYNDKIFFRFEALYGFRFNNEFESTNKKYFADLLGIFYSDSSIESRVLTGHGLTAKMAVGYRLINGTNK